MHRSTERLHQGNPGLSLRKTVDDRAELTPAFYYVIVTGLRLCLDHLIDLHEGMRVKVAYVRSGDYALRTLEGSSDDAAAVIDWLLKDRR